MIVNGLLTEHTEDVVALIYSQFGNEWRRLPLTYHKKHQFNVKISLWWDEKGLTECCTLTSREPWAAVRLGVNESLAKTMSLGLGEDDRLSVVAELEYEITPYVMLRRNDYSWIANNTHGIYVGPPNELDLIPSFDWNADRSEDEWTPWGNQLLARTRKLFRIFDSSNWIKFEELAPKIAELERQLVAGGAKYYASSQKEPVPFVPGDGAEAVRGLLAEPDKEGEGS